jgi:hypothetical protein
VAKAKKTMGVQQILLSPNQEVKALLEYLCQQSGKLYNKGIKRFIHQRSKAAKLMLNHCLKYNIGNIVCGWNEGFKSRANMGSECRFKWFC